MIEYLWGLKTVALFDVWSFVHFLSGASIGNIAHKHTKKRHPDCHSRTHIKLTLTTLIAIAYLWEIIEFYLEAGSSQVIQNWFYGVEFLPNRLISDPLVFVAGFFVVKSFPRLVLPARVFNVLWLLIHVFVFPHSMYLHTIY